MGRIPVVLRRVIICRRFSGEIGAYRIIPHAEHGIDMRGHMQRVWRGRRDLVVELSRRYAHRRERREIITVDHVMGDAWMVGLLFCFFVQYCGGLELLG